MYYCLSTLKDIEVHLHTQD